MQVLFSTIFVPSFKDGYFIRSRNKAKNTVFTYFIRFAYSFGKRQRNLVVPTVTGFLFYFWPDFGLIGQNVPNILLHAVGGLTAHFLRRGHPG